MCKDTGLHESPRAWKGWRRQPKKDLSLDLKEGRRSKQRKRLGEFDLFPKDSRPAVGQDNTSVKAAVEREAEEPTGDKLGGPQVSSQVLSLTGHFLGNEDPVRGGSQRADTVHKAAL